MRTPNFLDEDAIGLVEMLVAILILGIALSAMAAGLIAGLRATTENEHRVQATAVSNAVQEELQTLDWDSAGLYETELTPLAAWGVDLATDTFEGDSLVVIPGPDNTGCPVSDPDCGRNEQVPAPTETRTVNGLTFEIARIIVWRDADGDGVDDVKRFITLARWNELDGPLTERFTSERAATAEEAGDPTKPRVLQFDVGPSPMTLVDDRNGQDIKVIVRFSEGVQNAVLRFYRLEEPPADENEPYVETLVAQTVTLTATIADPANLGYDVQWETTIPADEYRWPDGPRPFYVSGTTSDATTIDGETSLAFTGGSVPPMSDGGDPVDDSGEVPPPSAVSEPVTVSQVSPGSPATICLHAGKNELWSTFTVSAWITGLTDTDWTASATFVPDGTSNAKVESLTPRGGTINPAGTWFDLTFSEGQNTGGFVDGSTLDFAINASRTGDGGGADAAGPVQSAQVTVQKRPSCS